jgi:hypothetical protein
LGQKDLIMITLTAKVKFVATIGEPFTLGASRLGVSLIGTQVNNEIDIGQESLISMEASIYDRSDLKFPSFGIISNIGNLVFKDRGSKFLSYANMGLLKEGIVIEQYINNTLEKNASEKISSFVADVWDYDNESGVVTVSQKDDLEEWQEINVPAISYDPRNAEDKAFVWLYSHLWRITVRGGNYNMLPFAELDATTKQVLENTYTKYPMLKSGSLWQQWTKLCQVCQLHIYKNSEGIIVCRYNGGN